MLAESIGTLFPSESVHVNGVSSISARRYRQMTPEKRELRVSAHIDAYKTNSRCAHACQTPFCTHIMVKATTESRPCPTCGEVFTKGKSMRKHREKTHETFKCTSCSCAFLDKTALALVWGFIINVDRVLTDLVPCYVALRDRSSGRIPPPMFMLQRYLREPATIAQALGSSS